MEFDEMIRKTELTSTKKHMHCINSIKSLLMIQENLQIEKAHKLRNIPKSKMKEFATEFTLFGFYTYNLRFLTSAFLSIKLDYTECVGDLVRSVYESIPKMYYITHHNNTRDIIYRDHISNTNNYMSYKQYKDEIYNNNIIDYDELFASEKTSKTKDSELYFKHENEFRDFMNSYKGGKWFSSKLYSKNINEKFNSIFSTLSSNTHPNLMKNYGFDKKPIPSSCFYECIQMLSYYNITAYCEFYHEEDTKSIINIKNQLKKLKLKFHPNNILILNLIPDNSNILWDNVYDRRSK